MAVSALIVDEEGLDVAVERICGRNYRIDVCKLLRCIEQLKPSHELLWVKWVVLDRSHHTEDGSDPREPYYRSLEAKGIRVERVRPKPINRKNGTYEPNACDFCVKDSIELGAQKASTVILLGGDGHFVSTMNKVHEMYGCRTELIYARHGISSDFRVDRIYYLEDLLEQFDLEFLGNGNAA